MSIRSISIRVYWFQEGFSFLFCTLLTIFVVFIIGIVGILKPWLFVFTVLFVAHQTLILCHFVWCLLVWVWWFFGDRFLGWFLFREDFIPNFFVLIAWSTWFLVFSLVLLLNPSLLLFLFPSSLFLLSVINFVVFVNSFLEGLFAKRHFWLSFELLLFGVTLAYFLRRAVGIHEPVLRFWVNLPNLFGRDFDINLSWEHFNRRLDEVFLVLNFFKKLAPLIE